MARFESEGTWFSAEARRERARWEQMVGRAKREGLGFARRFNDYGCSQHASLAAPPAAPGVPLRLPSPLHLPGGMLVDIESVGPSTYRVLRTYTAPVQSRAWGDAHPGTLDALRFELRKTLDEHGPAAFATPVRVERTDALPAGTVECVLREGTGGGGR